MVGVQAFAIIDKHGIVTASNIPSFIGMDVSSRPYFSRVATGAGGDQLYVNTPIKTPQNVWLLPLSRKITDAHGQFAGLVIAALDREEFQLLLSSSRYMPDMEVILAHGDDTIFMTVPPRQQATPGSPVEAGVVSGLSTRPALTQVMSRYGGERRLVAAHRVQPEELGMDQSLLLVLSRQTQAMYVEWRATMLAWVSGYGVLVLLSVLGLWLLHGQRRERQMIALRAERVLREKNRALEAANLLLETQRAQLQTMAFVDGLTGIANRRHFNEALSREWAHCHRIHAPLSLIMIDLDHFKLLNDHYGHQVGDECLIRVAQVLQVELYRAHDLTARYGGEEFVCLLPECEFEDARIKAERIRADVEALAIPNVVEQSPAILTISVGVACCVPDAQTDADSLISRADKALYHVKAAGRNRVACAPSISRS